MTEDITMTRLVAGRGAAAALAFCAVAVALVIVEVGAARSAGLSRRALAGVSDAKHPLGYYVLHPCNLVSQSQVAAVLHTRVGPGLPLVGTSGSGCGYRRTSNAASEENKNVDLEIIIGRVPSAKSIAVGKIVAEPSLGRSMYCVEIPAVSATAYADPGKANGRASYLYISTDSCPDSTTLVKDALAAIS